MLLTIIALVFGPMVLANNWGGLNLKVLATGVTVLAAMGGSWLAIRAGRGRAGRITVVVAFGLAVAARSWLLGGVESIPYSVWTLHVLMSALFLGARAAWVSGVVGCLVGAWLTIASIEGTLPPSAINPGPWQQFLFRAAAVLGAAALCATLVRGVRGTLMRLIAAENERRHQEERYELAIEGANYGVWDIDLTTNMVWIGPGLRKMVGLHEGAVVMSADAWRARIHPDDRAATMEALSRHQQGRSPVYQAEYRLKRADGTWAWIESRGKMARRQATRMVGSVQEISTRKAMERELEHRAFHDHLTGLPNRDLFLERLGRALVEGRRQGSPDFAVVFVDLDRFKVVNDSLGHSAGDKLLVLLATRLGKAVRAPDTVARLGGDEFTVLLRGPRDSEEARVAVSRIERAVNQPFSVDGQEVVVGASIGILMGSLEYEDPQELLRDADLAMYSVKGEGAGRVGVFEPGMRRRMRALLDLDSSLRRALDEDQLEPWFQPIVDVETGRIDGVEALARWRQADDTILSPGAFVARAEETGIIADIDRRIIEKAAHTVAWWNEEGRPLTLSVNLSARQFLRKDLTSFIDGVLERSALPANLLQLEITEGILLLDVPGIRSTLMELRQRGAHVAFDDFGTGYSSLSYLHQFDIQRLKIDRAFVQERGWRGPGPICRAIQSMATALGIETIAEGVETEAQIEGLKILGVPKAQGFLYGRPAPYPDGRPDETDPGLPEPPA